MEGVEGMCGEGGMEGRGMEWAAGEGEEEEEDPERVASASHSIFCVRWRLWTQCGVERSGEMM